MSLGYAYKKYAYKKKHVPIAVPELESSPPYGLPPSGVPKLLKPRFFLFLWMSFIIPDSWLSPPPKKILMVLKKQVRNMRGPDCMHAARGDEFESSHAPISLYLISISELYLASQW